jgi:fibronectin type 3 domain-containing protein
VVLTWTPESSVSNFNVYRSTTNGERGSKLGAPTSATYTDSTVTNGVTYYYEVTAVNAGGESSASTQKSAMPQVPAPGAPTGLTATAGNAQVALAWTSVSGATGYNLYRSTSLGQRGALIFDFATSTSYTDAWVTNGTTYYYEVTAVNAGGESVASAQQSATPQVPITGAPTGLAATSGSAQVSLTWTVVTGASSYNVYRSTTSGFTISSSSKIATTTTVSYTDTSVTNGTTYNYAVTALDAGGESPASSQQSATPQVPAPSAPIVFTATAGNAQVSLNWWAVTGATSYNIYRSVTSGQQGTKVGTSSVATYTDTSVTNGTAYYYEVTALNAGGESAASAQQSATPQVPIPNVPQGLSATGGVGQVTLTWSAVTGATGYSIYSWATGFPSLASATKIPVSGGTTTTYTQTGLAAGSQYYYEITATNAAGESSQSSPSIAATLALPLTPSQFTATNGNGQVSLSWTGPSSNLNIYWSTSPGVTTTSGTKVSVSGSSYTLSGLSNNTNYYFIMTSTNLAGESTPTSQITGCPRYFAMSTTSNGLASNYLRNIAVSNTSVYAVGVGVSVSAIGSNSWTNITPPSMLSYYQGSYPVATSVAVDGAVIVVGTSYGVNKSVDGGATWTWYSTANGLTNNNVNSVAVSGSTILVGTNGGGLSVSTNGGGAWSSVTSLNGLASNTVYSVAIFGSTLYAGTGSGLSGSTNGGTSWTTVTSSQGLAGNSIYDVVVSSSALWVSAQPTSGNSSVDVSTDNGATWKAIPSGNYGGPNTTPFGGGMAIAGSAVYVATGSSSNDVFVSSDGGTNWARYTSANGIGGTQVYGLAVAGGKIYLATNAGVCISQ